MPEDRAPIAALDRARAVLLDFDGPVCRLFAGLPAPQAARSLRNGLRRRGSEPPAEATGTDDPLAVLTAAAALGDDVAALADRLLVDIEVEAARRAAPTPGSDGLLRQCRRKGIPVAIVSNNSEPAVRSYLARHRLADLVFDVFGRPPGRPELMKPDPYVVDRALRGLDVPAAVTVMIGDSATDVAVARLRDVAAVGFANRPHKVEILRAAGATWVVTDLRELLDAGS